jgi:hypothetical protein
MAALVGAVLIGAVSVFALPSMWFTRGLPGRGPPLEGTASAS